ncbi:uncharacterized protein LOC123265005 isoform X1 [Cotesia glomerata]|uniref:uncharacterized protein LOC123265005 isoform X1 n=1 Tax=Cotesia glomerata TaxID=32391 RepID=UPI001D011FD6|nr:uncharacterized protein LOC123265005 isoform X1 [Cotesia glomerata]XP_044584508.1 uncharacterized protein LOC123265005 isoform X1 [Cotesia glomerata]XP_044584509.1 uncharacterized protein LOC123265005 isoform X1 [Cotesia glomerata]XP_044584510.1 uncharacterized protein LOC123265005 isoform X1 [Cotesia glomerata]XP_044584511.1 uncharacterized protein LOC123265005 isoform X1 [Cotesia glomerata]
MGVSTAPEQHRRGFRYRWEPLDVEAVAPAASVAVMAPALTEGGPQKPADLINPLPASGFLSSEQAAQFFNIQVCQNREVLAKFVVSASVQPSKIDEQCLRGISKDLIRDVINSQYASKFESLSMFTNGTDLIAPRDNNKDQNDDQEINFTKLEEEEAAEEEEEGGGGGEEGGSEAGGRKTEHEAHVAEELHSVMPNCNQAKNINTIMSDPSSFTAASAAEDINIPAGPPTTHQTNDDMGFLKANETEVSMVVDDELPADVKDIDMTPMMELNDELQANVVGDIGNDVVGDIGHNVDDILQVIKSMEGVEQAIEDPGDAIIPSGSSETGVPCPEIFPISDTALASFSSEMFNEVVMKLVDDNIGMNMNMNMNMNINMNMNMADSSEAQRTANLQVQQDTVEHRQFELERRTAFLMRRLRKLQAKFIARHAAEETTSVLEQAHQSVKPILLQDLPMLMPKGTQMKNLSENTHPLSAFLQRVEKSCAAQSNSVNRQRSYCRYFGGGSRDNVTSISLIGSSGVVNAASVNSGVSSSAIGNTGSASSTRHPLLGTSQIKVDKKEVEHVAGSLATQLHTIEASFDSDCTVSSSGGESCDEMQTFNNTHQYELPIIKRAAWRYAQDRAAIASRWTWLNAQISDLEYRIRQHNDLQRVIRQNKGQVVLEGTETVNGYSGTLPGLSNRYNSPEAEQQCARTRGFVSDTYRKRKLLRIDGLHELSKRAARPSTVRCDCDQTMASCALCTGRIDPMQPQEPFDQLSVPERIAMVDPCYHPVLSFPDEVLHSTHMDAIMKTTDWQQKMLRGSTRIPRIKEKERESIERRNKPKLPPEHNKPNKYNPQRMKKTSSSTIITARLKRKMLKGKREKLSNSGTPVGGRNLTGLNRKRVNKLSQQNEDEDDVSQSSSSKHSSPVPSPLQHPAIEKILPKEKSSNSHGRTRQQSFDIDNIVIPYSVAAATRVEKLQYKEILTPKWRICDDITKTDVKNGVIHRPSQDSDVEDVSDEAIAQRHERSEREENKRFMTYLSTVPQNRLRHSRRTDSRADSGANTPDPMSPHPSELGDVTSPLTSPPATPMSSHDADHPNTLDSQRNSLQNAIRRRTISSARTCREEASSTNPEEDSEVPAYEPRLFPLSEEVYDKMVQIMPDGHLQSTTSAICPQATEKIPNYEADPASPGSDTTESAYCDADGEDPNDPEWTVGDERDTEKERIRLTTKR